MGARGLLDNYYSASYYSERTQLFVRINDKQGPWKEQKSSAASAASGNAFDRDTSR